MFSDAAEPAALASRLAGEEVVRATPAPGGRNSRVFCVETASGRLLALKIYPQESGRDRLGNEYRALSFLTGAGIGTVPWPLVRDPVSRAALYSWISGSPLEGAADAQAVCDLAAFLRTVHDARHAPGAEALSAAAEAVTSTAELKRQIEGRLERLSPVASGHPELAEVLAGIRRTLAEYRLGGGDALPRERQTLSPADIGFHNALRRQDGTLAFVDFEYFGWDDPVKLVSDVLWHPGHRLGPAEALQFRSQTAEIYSTDREFEARLAALFPLFGLRWALIVLNEFLPDERRRREFAGRTGDRLEIEERQLAKARDFVERVRACRA